MAISLDKRRDKEKEDQGSSGSAVGSSTGTTQSVTSGSDANAFNSFKTDYLARQAAEQARLQQEAMNQLMESIANATQQQAAQPGQEQPQGAMPVNTGNTGSVAQPQPGTVYGPNLPPSNISDGDLAWPIVAIPNLPPDDPNLIPVDPETGYLDPGDNPTQETIDALKELLKKKAQERNGGGKLTGGVLDSSQYPISTKFGAPSQAKDKNTNGKPHYGIDIAAPPGSAVTSPTGGVIDEVNSEVGGVKLKADNGMMLDLQHMDPVQVEQGARVEAGDPLGLVGNEGAPKFSNGPHLHIALFDQSGQPIDPTPFYMGENNPFATGGNGDSASLALDKKKKEPKPLDFLSMAQPTPTPTVGAQPQFQDVLSQLQGLNLKPTPAQTTNLNNVNSSLGLPPNVAAPSAQLSPTANTSNGFNGMDFLNILANTVGFLPGGSGLRGINSAVQNQRNQTENQKPEVLGQGAGQIIGPQLPKEQPFSINGQTFDFNNPQTLFDMLSNSASAKYGVDPATGQLRNSSASIIDQNYGFLNDYINGGNDFNPEANPQDAQIIQSGTLTPDAAKNLDARTLQAIRTLAAGNERNVLNARNRQAESTRAIISDTDMRKRAFIGRTAGDISGSGAGSNAVQSFDSTATDRIGQVRNQIGEQLAQGQAGFDQAVTGLVDRDAQNKLQLQFQNAQLRSQAAMKDNDLERAYEAEKESLPFLVYQSVQAAKANDSDTLLKNLQIAQNSVAVQNATLQQYQQALLAATDPAAKAQIQAQIDKLQNDTSYSTLAQQLNSKLMQLISPSAQ